MGLLSIVEWDRFMDVDRMPKVVSLDVDGDAIMVDYSARKPTFAVKSRRKLRSRMLQVTGMVKELGLVMEMTEPGETAKIATKEYQVHGEGAQVGERHRDEPQGAGGQNTIYIKEMEDGVTLEAGASEQTQQAWQNDGIKYCPDMGNVLLPSYFPVKYKPGYSGSRDRAEELQLSELQKPVCLREAFMRKKQK